jgi:hypothetical protein
MKKLALFLAFCCLFYSASLLAAPKMPKVHDEGLSEEAWRVYTKNLLLELFPNDGVLANKLVIEIVASGRAGASFYCPEWEACSRSVRPTIRITRGLISLLGEEHYESEYAAVVVHEFGHIKLDHGSTSVPSGDLVMGEAENFILLEKQEVEADQFTTALLAKRSLGSCALSSALETVFFFNEPKWRDKPEDPYNKIRRKRLALAMTACADGIRRGEK